MAIVNGRMGNFSFKMHHFSFKMHHPSLKMHPFSFKMFHFIFKLVICRLKMANLSFQRVPGQDLAENGPFVLENLTSKTAKMLQNGYFQRQNGQV